MQDFSPVMRDGNKHIDRLKTQCPNHKEINGRNMRSVILQKRPPPLPLIGASLGFSHVFGHRIITDIKPQFGQFALNPLSGPMGIVLLKFSYQLDEFPINLRPADLSGLP